MRKKRKNTETYEELLNSYYAETGRAVIKKEPVEINMVISKSFNNGEILAQKYTNKKQQEYVVQRSVSDADFEEYVVVKGDTPPQQNSGAPPAPPVSAVQEYRVDVLNPLPTPKPPATADNNNKPAPSYVETPPKPEAPPQPPAASAPNPVQQNEDNFEADIQAILNGQKVFDPVTKQTVDKDLVGRPQNGQPPVATDGATREFKNEHAIFDKIAQSMQYANAYDLGTVELEKRLSQIDREIDTERKIPVVRQQTAYRQQTGEAKLGNAEFIRDLDSIQRGSEYQPMASRSFSAVSYSIPGIINPMRQPTGMVCWATVATMMMSWKRAQSLTIEEAIGSAGSVYLSKFLANEGLTAAEKTGFLAAAGLTFEYPQSFSVPGYENLLRTYGPVWVTTDEDPSVYFAIHARIITGIEGDGTPQNTYLTIIDPARGTQYKERFSAFLVKYEQEARDAGASWSGRIQVVHWPAGTQPGAGPGIPFQQSLYNTPPYQPVTYASAQATDNLTYSYARSVTGVVNGAVITDAFYRNAEEKLALTKRSSGRSQHLGIDVSLSNASGGDVTDKRRGLPVFAAIKTVVPLSDLNAVRTATGTGMGLQGAGSASLLNAVVLTQPWADDGNAYGGVLGLACRYQYADESANQQTITLYIEFLHLITSRYPPKNGNGTVIPLADWLAAHPGQADFGPLMVNESVLPSSTFTAGSYPLIGYLGATEFPHVHIQAAFASGTHKYLKSVRFDPEVILA